MSTSSQRHRGGRLIIVDRTCEVWAVGLTWRLRLLDRLRHGHARHRCDRDRPFMREHVGDHRCACGVTFLRLATDND